MIFAAHVIDKTNTDFAFQSLKHYPGLELHVHYSIFKVRIKPEKTTSHHPRSMLFKKTDN